MSSPTAAPSAEHPTKFRQVVMVLIASASATAYLTRHAIAPAVTTIQAEAGLTSEQMGLILGIFSLGYFVFQVPTGWLGIRFGTRFLPRDPLRRLVALHGLVRFGFLLHRAAGRTFPFRRDASGAGSQLRQGRQGLVSGPGAGLCQRRERLGYVGRRRCNRGSDRADAGVVFPGE